MQQLISYVSAASTLGVVKDYANVKSEEFPTLMRGVATELVLRLFANSDGLSPYPLDKLQSVAAWQWIIDKDWSAATAPLLTADNSLISVRSVTESIDSDEILFTEVRIPLSQTNTERLASELDGKEVLDNLAGQLLGCDINGSPVFVLQLKGISIRNRLDSAGTPQPVKSEYLTETQVRALLKNIEFGNISAANIKVLDDAGLFNSDNIELVLHELGTDMININNTLAGVNSLLAAAAESIEEL